MAPVGQHDGDVLMGQNVLEQAQRLRLRYLVGPCAVGVLLVAVHEVHVQVDAADIVLVVLAVTVVIGAFDVERVPGPLALVAIRLDVEPLVGRIRHHVRLLDVQDTHHGDQTVTVEVVGRILVDLAVAIGVVGPHGAAPVHLDLGKETLGGIRVDARNDIERVLGQELDRGFIGLAGHGQETRRDLKRHLGSDQMIAVDIGGEQEGRPPLGIDISFQCQSQRPQRTPLATGGDRLRRADTRVLRDQPDDFRGKLGVGAVARRACLLHGLGLGFWLGGGLAGQAGAD